MAEKKKGYIPLWRDIQDHWLWTSDEPFDSRSAWIDLLMMANHEDKTLKIGCNKIVIHAGQMWTSYVKLADRWRWSKPRVIRYTKLLKSDGMIHTDGTPSGTLLTIVNYGFFALPRTARVTAPVTADVPTPITAHVTARVTQTIKNNNYKNERIMKEKKAEPLLDENGLPPLDLEEDWQ